MDKPSQAAMSCLPFMSEELGVWPGWSGNGVGTDQPAVGRDD